MIRKNQHEKLLIRNIFIFPIIIILVFAFIGYVTVNYFVIPKSDRVWEEQLEKEYYNEERNKIQEETVKIYSLIKNERQEQKRLFKKYLKQQNDTFTAVTKKGITYDIIDRTLNFKVMPIEEFEQKYPDLYFEAKVTGIEGSIEWREEGVVYQGYFRFCEHNFYVTYANKKEQQEKDKKTF